MTEDMISYTSISPIGKTATRKLVEILASVLGYHDD